MHHGPVQPLTSPTGDVFLDARGGDRTLRVTWHVEVGVAVLSLWRGRVCTGSFRLAADDVPRFVEALREAEAGLDTIALASEI